VRRSSRYRYNSSGRSDADFARYRGRILVPSKITVRLRKYLVLNLQGQELRLYGKRCYVVAGFHSDLSGLLFVCLFILHVRPQVAATYVATGHFFQPFYVAPLRTDCASVASLS